jgi:Bacterial PH domain
MSAPQQSGQTGRPGQADEPGQPTQPGQPGQPTQPGQATPAAQATQPGQAAPAAQPVRPPDVYRSVAALVIWWVWVVFAAANLLDLAIQGHNHFAAAVAAVLILITGITFVTAFRPRVVAYDEHLLIRNPLRDHRIPWGCVESLVLRDSLEIHCEWQDGGPRRRKLYAWSVHSPRRTRVKAEMRARRKITGERNQRTAFDQLPPEAKAAVSKTNEEQIVDSLRGRGARCTTGDPGGPVSRWDLLALALVVLPALLVVIVVLT